jgi:protocatechuate 3,4-dioxygenase beta subunit
MAGGVAVAGAAAAARADTLVPTSAQDLGPFYPIARPADHDADLTRIKGRGGVAMGQPINVIGRIVDLRGNPIRGAQVDLWQCNAAGRYAHANDRHDAPLDPNFHGHGRVLTDDEGRYRFVTIRPGAYPWNNHRNAWRPAHIHFSLFGNVHAQRLVTQMYFPGDPLIEHDVIINTIADEAARRALVSRFSLDETVPDQALGFVYDIVLRGRDATPFGL